MESWSYATGGNKPVGQTYCINHFHLAHGAYAIKVMQCTIYAALFHLCWDKMSKEFWNF